MAKKIVRLSVSDSDIEKEMISTFTINNFEVCPYATTRLLLTNVKTRETDLVVAETGSPVMDGFELCHRMREKEFTRGIPVILLSERMEDEERAVSAGANAFLVIPFSGNELLEIARGLTGKKKRVLIVDDSKLIHKRTGTFLRDQGFEVLEAFDGAQGLIIARSEKPDLIISDVEMPEMNGFQMCHKIKNDPETALIPLIIVSSLDGGLDIEKGFNSGANDYLVKPVVHAELLSCMNVLFNTMELRNRETILVVDDSSTITNMLRMGLMQQGFNVVVSNNGDDAYEKALEINPDLIISDIELPGVDGIQLVKYLKEQPVLRNTPIIIISARESRGAAAREMRISASAFISKPFTMDKVLVTVERLTAERRMSREREAMKLYLSEAAADVVAGVSMKKSAVCEFQANEKILTILFSDIVGFTPICEKYPPSQVVSILNLYLDEMTTVLKDHDAVIDKFIGDAIMAIFAPVAGREIPQVRAVKAALKMLEAQKNLNMESPEKLHTRIGINTGSVIFGDIGSRFYRRDFTVIGDAVNIAQRLESAAEPDSVLISESVFEKIGGAAKVIEMGNVKLKGKNEDIRSFQVLELTL
jgi:DNA-binding response OmpR family regulator